MKMSKIRPQVAGVLFILLIAIIILAVKGYYTGVQAIATGLLVLATKLIDSDEVERDRANEPNQIA